MQQRYNPQEPIKAYKFFNFKNNIEKFAIGETYEKQNGQPVQHYNGYFFIKTLTIV